MINIITSGVYGHSIILLMALLFTAAVTKLNQAEILVFSIFIFLLWFFVEFYYVLRAEQFWMSIFHLTFISLVIYGVFILILLASEKYGVRARGDGAGWGYILAPFIYIYILVATLFLKGVATLWKYLFY